MEVDGVDKSKGTIMELSKTPLQRAAYGEAQTRYYELLSRHRQERVEALRELNQLFVLAHKPPSGEGN